jgi:hypothetical protein
MCLEIGEVHPSCQSRLLLRSTSRRFQHGRTDRAYMRATSYRCVVSSRAFRSTSVEVFFFFSVSLSLRRRRWFQESGRQRRCRGLHNSLKSSDRRLSGLRLQVPPLNHARATDKQPKDTTAIHRPELLPNLSHTNQSSTTHTPATSSLSPHTRKAIQHLKSHIHRNHVGRLRKSSHPVHRVTPFHPPELNPTSPSNPTYNPQHH